MELLEAQELKHYTSMRIGGPATLIGTVRSEDDVIALVGVAHEKKLPVITLGDGTNVVFSDAGFTGVIAHNQIMGFSIDAHGLATIGAGENWDSVVQRTIDAGFWGIEAMSLIPGTAGATPVNNVGAYGQEIADTIVRVRAYDTVTNDFVELKPEECGFAYRTSRFKNEDHGRFIITQITLQLHPIDSSYTAPTYPSLAGELTAEGNTAPTPTQVRKAVIAVRTSKLPDPAVVPNSGSFFKNALITKEAADTLKATHPDIPLYPYGQQFKVASGWLIEQAGLKNYRANGMWVYDKQALVLVNESAETFDQLQKMITHIRQTVFDVFGITIEPEPELL